VKKGEKGGKTFIIAACLRYDANKLISVRQAAHCQPRATSSCELNSPAIFDGRVTGQDFDINRHIFLNPA